MCGNVGRVNVTALLSNVVQPYLPWLQEFYVELSSDFQFDFYEHSGQLPSRIDEHMPFLEQLTWDLRGFGLGPLPQDLGRVRKLYLNAQGLTGSVPEEWVVRMLERAPNVTSASPLALVVKNLRLAVNGPTPRRWGAPGVEALKRFAALEAGYEGSLYTASNCLPDRLFNFYEESMPSLVSTRTKCSEADGQVAALSALRGALSGLSRSTRGVTFLSTWVVGAASVPSGNKFGDPVLCLKWRGVRCDEEGWVTALDLPFVLSPTSGLTLASLVPQLSALPRLTRLNLKGNGLAGSLPEGLVALGGLSIVDLSANNLSGSLPSAWMMLSGLRVLNLGLNRITGTFPASWAALQDLEELYLGRNALSGSLPAVLGLLQSLEILDLSNNGRGITGSLPLAWVDPDLVPATIRAVQAEIAAAREAAVQAAQQARAEAAVYRSADFITAAADVAAVGKVDSSGPTVEQIMAKVQSAAAALAAPTFEVAAASVQGLLPLGNLRTLYLRGNGLSGTLPPQWGTLTGLEVRTNRIQLRAHVETHGSKNGCHSCARKGNKL
jgi:hypothetical protein